MATAKTVMTESKTTSNKASVPVSRTPAETEDNSAVGMRNSRQAGAIAKTAKKKTVSRKSRTSKAAAKKAAAKKVTTKKSTAKKKATGKKTAAGKTATRKTATRKTATRKPQAKKSAGKNPQCRKTSIAKAAPGDKVVRTTTDESADADGLVESQVLVPGKADDGNLIVESTQNESQAPATETIAIAATIKTADAAPECVADTASIVAMPEKGETVGVPDAAEQSESATVKEETKEEVKEEIQSGGSVPAVEKAEDDSFVIMLDGSGAGATASEATPEAQDTGDDDSFLIMFDAVEDQFTEIQIDIDDSGKCSVHLPSDIRFQRLDKVKEGLVTTLDASEVTVDASDVCRMDAASLQLLWSYSSSLKDSNIPLELKGMSAEFEKSSELSGLVASD